MDDDDVQDDESGVLNVREHWLAPTAWSLWRESARGTIRKAEAGSMLVAIAVGLVSWVALSTLLPDDRRFEVAYYTIPLLVLLAWYVARGALQRTLFAPTARQMRMAIVPTLLHRASSDELFKLARRGASGFVPESVIVRAEERGAAVYLVATEYDVSKGNWVGGAGDAGGG